jgi:hypothetical protein
VFRAGWYLNCRNRGGSEKPHACGASVGAVDGDPDVSLAAVDGDHGASVAAVDGNPVASVAVVDGKLGASVAAVDANPCASW